jgi:predicted RNase H-like nuclease (RuvC/YqgF family)
MNMDIEEFLTKDKEEETKEETTVEEALIPEDIELDVQKAVVESLAAEKIECDERIKTLGNEKLHLTSENEELKNKIAELENKLSQCSEELTKVGDILAANSETTASNKIALLDRNVDIADRFLGETREQVLEVIREARDQAEADGRIRRAQVLEGVLIANESTGELAKKRSALEKFFNDNGNILSGIVITELDRCGISYKNGEDYLLPAEIIKRTY